MAKFSDSVAELRYDLHPGQGVPLLAVEDVKHDTVWSQQADHSEAPSLRLLFWSLLCTRPCNWTGGGPQGGWSCDPPAQALTRTSMLNGLPKLCRPSESCPVCADSVQLGVFNGQTGQPLCQNVTQVARHGAMNQVSTAGRRRGSVFCMVCGAALCLGTLAMAV